MNTETKKKNIFNRFLNLALHLGNAAHDNKREMEELSKDPAGVIEKYSIINQIRNNMIM